MFYVVPVNYIFMCLPDNISRGQIFMNLKYLLGKKIQQIRKHKNITQEQLVELVGLDVSSVSHIETGKHYPSSENLEKIIETLKIKPNELFSFEEPTKNDELIEEMYMYMKTNKKITRILYNIYTNIKYDI